MVDLSCSQFISVTPSPSIDSPGVFLHTNTFKNRSTLSVPSLWRVGRLKWRFLIFFLHPPLCEWPSDRLHLTWTKVNKKAVDCARRGNIKCLIAYTNINSRGGPETRAREPDMHLSPRAHYILQVIGFSSLV